MILYLWGSKTYFFSITAEDCSFTDTERVLSESRWFKNCWNKKYNRTCYFSRKDFLIIFMRNRFCGGLLQSNPWWFHPFPSKKTITRGETKFSFSMTRNFLCIFFISYRTIVSIRKKKMLFRILLEPLFTNRKCDFSRILTVGKIPEKIVIHLNPDRIKNFSRTI